MREPARIVLLLALLLPGCALVRAWSRPDGAGGWSAAQRSQELRQRARAAGVPAPGVVSAAEPAAAPALLDLPAALERAQHANRRILEAADEVERARQRVFAARAGLLPSTAGSGRYTWYSDAQQVRINLPPALLAQAGGAAAPAATIRDQAFGVLNGTVTLPLDVSGEIRQLLLAAQAGYRGEQARLWATTLDEELAVARAYFQLLSAQQLREVTRQRLAADRQQAADAESRYGAGRITKNELLVVQVAVRNDEQELTQRELAIDAARWALNQAIGAEVDAPTQVADVPTRPAIPPAQAAICLAYDSNPALRALVEEQQQLEATQRALVRSRLPRLSGGGAVDYSSSTIITPQRLESGFVGFTWDLGSDTRREAAIAEARAATAQNRTRIERQLRELEHAIRLSHGAAEERLAALDTAAVAVNQAEENVRIRQQQFAAGRATSEDVLDAQALLEFERATLATARYDAHSRLAELQALIGLPLSADEIPPCTPKTAATTEAEP